MNFFVGKLLHMLFVNEVNQKKDVFITFAEADVMELLLYYFLLLISERFPLLTNQRKADIIKRK